MTGNVENHDTPGLTLPQAQWHRPDKDSVSLLLKRALDWAAVWHRDHRRKYPGIEVPYISHPAGVVAILARHGFDEEILAAGALHDVMEDAGVSHEELVARFGMRVADLVRECSEPDKTWSWEARKTWALAHFPRKSWEAQAITLADKIDNLRSILVCAADHGNPWAMFEQGRVDQLARFDALVMACTSLNPHSLITEFQSVLEALRNQRIGHGVRATTWVEREKKGAEIEKGGKSWSN